jgi:hypothetical protein
VNNATVQNCIVERFEVGIRLRAATNCTVRHSTAQLNTRYGIEVTQGSTGALIRTIPSPITATKGFMSLALRIAMRIILLRITRSTLMRLKESTFSIRTPTSLSATQFAIKELLEFISQALIAIASKITLSLMTLFIL